MTTNGPESLPGDLLRTRDMEGTLKFITTVSIEQGGVGAALPGHQLAAVVRFLLEREPERDGRGEPLTPGELMLCCELASEVIVSPDSAFGVPVSDTAWSMQHRAAYQQLPDGEASGYVPRSLALYRQIAPGLQDSSGFAFEAAYEQAYGVTIDQVWVIGRALWERSQEHPGESIDAADLASHIAVDGVGAAQVESFFAIMACDYATFRSMLGVPSGEDPHFEPYNINPFRKFPILKLPDGKYLAPIRSYLMRRITHGLYYDLIELDRGGFIRLVANAYFGYVGKLIEGQSGVRSLPGGVWLIDSADTTIVIECITRPFGAMSRSTGNREDLRADLARRGGVVDHVIRLREQLDAVATTGRSDGTAKRTAGLIVALEDFYQANGPFIRGVIDEELEARSFAPMDACIQLAHVSGLEALSALSTRTDVPITELMAAKVERSEHGGLELDAFVRYQVATLLPGQDPLLRPRVFDDVVAAYLGP